MKSTIRVLKVAQNFCFTRQIHLVNEGLKKQQAETAPANSQEAVLLFQELLVMRRQRNKHENLCSICARSEQRSRRQYPVSPSNPQASWIGAR